MKLRDILILLLLPAFATLLNACSAKEDFLNEKTNANLAVISTLDDVAKLLDNTRYFNFRSAPALGGNSADEYYYTEDQFLSASQEEQNTYIWAKDIFPAGTEVWDWTVTYSQVMYANTALEALEQIGDNSAYAGKLKGTALFYRSYAFFNLLQIFSMPYDAAKADELLGIHIRKTSDLNTPVTRETQRQCYDQVFADLAEARLLLPETTPFNTQPNQVSLQAFLARIYLTIGDYSNALKHADSCLKKKSALTDYNDLTKAAIGISPDVPYPLVEVLYNSRFNITASFAGFRMHPDSVVLKMYEENDLRKQIFFTNYFGYLTYDGSYEYNNYGPFGGLATDEIYLIRAECQARAGNTTGAMDDLNALLVKRYKTGTFVPLTATDADDALVQVLRERRKELHNRGLRWLDLRRLNKEPRFAVTLKRVINGAEYTLPPNDPRYALPLPDLEIQLSGVPQNQR